MTGLNTLLVKHIREHIQFAQRLEKENGLNSYLCSKKMRIFFKYEVLNRINLVLKTVGHTNTKLLYIIYIHIHILLCILKLKNLPEVYK